MRKDWYSYIGQQFNRWTILDFFGVENSQSLFVCVCSCGTIKLMDCTTIVTGITKSCGCQKFKNVTGMRFGKLVAIESVGTDNHHNAKWLFQCDCGNTKIGRIQTAKVGRLKSCGCIMKSVGKQHPTHLGNFGHIPKSIYNAIRNTARRGGDRIISFNVSGLYLSKILVKQQFKCALSGVDIYINDSAHTGKGTASLDRIDSSKGYVKGNVWWVHQDINRMKWELKLDEFYLISDLITKNRDRSKRLLKWLKNK